MRVKANHSRWPRASISLVFLPFSISLSQKDNVLQQTNLPHIVWCLLLCQQQMRESSTWTSFRAEERSSMLLSDGFITLFQYFGESPQPQQERIWFAASAAWNIFSLLSLCCFSFLVSSSSGPSKLNRLLKILKSEGRGFKGVQSGSLGCELLSTIGLKQSTGQNHWKPGDTKKDNVTTKQSSSAVSGLVAVRELGTLGLFCSQKSSADCGKTRKAGRISKYCETQNTTYYIPDICR